MATQWYLGRDRQKVGPFTIEEIKQLASLGIIRQTEFILSEGSRTWVAASSIFGLFPEDERKRYWLSFGGQVLGPFDGATIRDAVLHGRVPSNAHVCPEGTQQWVPLEKQQKFQEAVKTTRDSGVVCTATLSKEEAALHLAGKSGDSIAKLVSTLMDLKRRNTQNATLAGVIDNNIRALLSLREKGAMQIDDTPVPIMSPSAKETKRDDV